MTHLLYLQLTGKNMCEANMTCGYVPIGTAIFIKFRYDWTKSTSITKFITTDTKIDQRSRPKRDRTKQKTTNDL